jgi:lipoprotein-anchoring transpeptidase ErfK/SrfK
VLAGGEQSDSPSPSATKTVSDARLQVNLPRRGQVGVDKLVEVTATNGTLKKVRVTSGRGPLTGDLSDDGTTWTAGDRLEPGRAYRLRGVAVDSDGMTRSVQRTFSTPNLTLDQQTYASIAPLQGETVGVGMPVIVTFDVPVTDRAEVERNMSVDTQPAQPGTWHWISDTEVHWRPKTYWKAGTDVTVNADINGVNAGNGIYGQEDRVSKFHVGDAVVMKIDIARHHMRVLRNGQLLRTIPVTGGKPGFTTRSGIKVIIEKFRSKRMDSATTGIDPGNPEYYNLSNVEYAQRVTYSGEFIHAAPWSVGSQGYANVSHGCVGMSTANAAWLYSLTKRGDVVDVTGTDRPMESTNGYGDWNVSWGDYKAGSALR